MERPMRKESVVGKEVKAKALKMSPRILFSCFSNLTNQSRSETEVPYNPTHDEKVFVNGTTTTIKEACGAGVKNVWAKGAFDKQSGKLRSRTADPDGSEIELTWKPMDPDDIAIVAILLRTANAKLIFMTEVVMEDNMPVLKPHGCLFHEAESCFESTVTIE